MSTTLGQNCEPQIVFYHDFYRLPGDSQIGLIRVVGVAHEAKQNLALIPLILEGIFFQLLDCIIPDFVIRVKNVFFHLPHLVCIAIQAAMCAFCVYVCCQLGILCSTPGWFVYDLCHEKVPFVCFDTRNLLALTTRARIAEYFLLHFLGSMDS